MKFLLQKDVLFDFIFALQKSKEWYDWWQPKADIIEFVEEGCSKDICPVGSLEFCLDYYKQLGIDLKPINVPEKLWACGIGYVPGVGSGKNITLPDFMEKLKTTNKIDDERFHHLMYEFSPGWFIKSEERFKAQGNGHYSSIGDFLNSQYYNPKEKYQITRLEKGLLDEWRIFVFEGEILDIKRYASEDPRKFCLPSDDIIDLVLKKIDLPAYSFDLGVIDPGLAWGREEKHKTVVIEVHDFFSTGLYGAELTSKLPYMFYRSHLHKFV